MNVGYRNEYMEERMRRLEEMKAEKERKIMCEYCEIREPYATIAERDGSFMRIVRRYPGKIVNGHVNVKDIPEGQSIAYIITRSPVDYIAAEINYCPFCGRKL